MLDTAEQTQLFLFNLAVTSCSFKYKNTELIQRKTHSQNYQHTLLECNMHLGKEIAATVGISAY